MEGRWQLPGPRRTVVSLRLPHSDTGAKTQARVLAAGKFTITTPLRRSCHGSIETMEVL